MSEPAVWCRGPGLSRLQSPDGAAPGWPVTWDMRHDDTDTWDMTHLTHTPHLGHSAKCFTYLKNHQDWKRLRYKKLHSNLTFPELNMSCMCLFNLIHSFLEHSCFCLSKSFMWSLFIECAWSNFVLATSYLLHYYISMYVSIITWTYSLTYLISNLCECWYQRII